MPIRLQLLSSYYPHLGDHMGFRQVRKYFDPDAFHVSEHLVNKFGKDLPTWLRVARRMTRNRFSTPPRVYLVEDWLAERKLLSSYASKPFDILQYLDGEHSFKYGARWLQQKRLPVKTLAMFHMPMPQLEHRLFKDSVKELDAVVAIAPDQAAWFKSWIEPERVHLVLHGVDDQFFTPAPNGPPQNTPFRIITVGQNFRDYDLHFKVAEAMRGHPNLEFHVVRKFPEGTRLPANLVVHSGISDEALADLYRSCHACLLPLVNATASNTLQEAMATGIPTVVSDLPSMRAYDGGAGTLFFPVGDVDAAVAQIESLLDNESLRLELGRKARQRAETINWRASAQSLAAVYTGLKD